jgi:ATP-dependent DNA ligase
VRLYSRNANEWTVRLPAIAAATERIGAKSFTIDGEAVVLGPTAYHDSTTFVVGRPYTRRSSRHSI